MAKSSSSRSRRSPVVAGARRTLIWFLLLIVALTGLNWVAVALQGGQWTPKLALDLEGGTQVVLEAKLGDGQAQPTPEQMSQAVSIIRQRIDAAGVSEAEITTQGGKNIVVSVPGEMDDQTRNRIEASSKLEFRPVLAADTATNIQVITPDMLPEGTTINATPTAPATDASDTSQITDQLYLDYLAYDCNAPVDTTTAPADQPLITCDDTNTQKFILGPVEIEGSHIANATSGIVSNQQGVSTGQWAVNLTFDGEGASQFQAVTQRLLTIGSTLDSQTGQADTTRNRFAVTVDGRVIVAPSANAVITDGKAQITGSFTEETAKTLADQLKFGALPFSFTAPSTQTISATLGSSQLVAGLIAGAIGLGLVVIYSLFQYRALGLLTVASLVFSAVISYLVVTFLSNQEGYRLSLAGVAGLIVAIGITADSFIVYFERIKDELREGRSLPAAIEHGWNRAIRTIVVSDAVNLLVAIILFVVAVGNVRGFALTLGMTTLIDLVIVTLFTHPTLRLLATTRFFGEGHRFSGLDPRALGAVYRGRGEFRATARRTSDGATREAQRRQTLAERKAAALTAKGDD